MKKTFLTLAAISTFSTLSLSGRELLCEQCIEEECIPHLFVERSEILINTTFLYWTAEEGALDYAVKARTTPSTLDTFAIGDYKTADFDWRPGYRLAATYYRCFRYWEVTGEYTWLYDAGSDHTQAPLNPTRQTATKAPFETAHSSIGLHYSLGDFYAARVFDPNPHLRMRVLGGLTMSIIEQGWKNIYSNFQDDFDKVKEKWSFWGGGIRFGTTVDWYWTSHLYLTGKFSLAGLIGTYKNQTLQTHGADEIVLSHAKYDDHRFSMHTQLMLGPSWQMPCDCWSFELFAGYEINLWFNLQERIRTEFNAPDATKATFYSDGLLGLQGLTLRMTIGF